MASRSRARRRSRRVMREKQRQARRPYLVIGLTKQRRVVGGDENRSRAFVSEVCWTERNRIRCPKIKADGRARSTGRPSSLHRFCATRCAIPVRPATASPVTMHWFGDTMHAVALMSVIFLAMCGVAPCRNVSAREAFRRTAGDFQRWRHHFVFLQRSFVASAELTPCRRRGISFHSDSAFFPLPMVWLILKSVAEEGVN